LFFSNNYYLYSYDSDLPISNENPKIIGNRGNGLVVYNNKLYYEEASQYPDSWLWVYDDNQSITSTNPKKLTDNPQINSTSLGFRFNSIVYNSKLYYCGSNLNDKNYELYVYDSALPITNTNPKKINEINSGSNASTPTDFIIFNNKIYFSADDGTGNELFVYDGINNPQKVYDIDSSPYGGQATQKAIYNDNLYFAGHNNTYGTELWKYNGTSNPIIVADIYSGTEFSIPLKLKTFYSRLLFSANDGIHGRELYVFDSNLNVSSTNPKIFELNIGSGDGMDLQSDFIEYNGNLYISGKTNSSNIGLFTINSNFLNINETEQKTSIIIYPNPTNKYFNISSKELINKIEIHNLNGQLIEKILIKNNDSSQIEMKQKGIYLISIYTDNQVITNKLIVQ